MNPEQADKQLRQLNGLPVVGLLRNPHGGPDGTGAYISLVGRPSTEIDFRVCRAVEPVAKPDAAWWEKLGDWRNWPVIGSLVARSGTDFNAEWAAGELNNVMWRGFDILTSIFYQALRDPLITDKRGVIANAFNQFRDRVLSMLPGEGTTSDQYTEISRAAVAQIETVQRAGKVISAKNMAELAGLLEGLQALQERLNALIEAGGGDPAGATTSRAAPAPQQQEVSVDPKQIVELAKLGADLAVQQARAINPSIAAAELIKIGAEAQDRIIRAAIQGAMQPAVPENTLEKQIAQFGVLGAMRDPTAMASSAVVGDLVARSIEKALEPIAAKLAEIGELAKQHDVLLLGGTLVSRGADGKTVQVETRGLLSAARGGSAAIPERIARGAGGAGEEPPKPVADPFRLNDLVNPPTTNP